MSIKIRNIPLASSIFHTGKRLLKTFHALPLSHTNSIIDSKYREEYEYLFKTLNNIDITVTDPFIDSPVQPHTTFAAAEELAAIAFDADRTLFITGGSTLAIQIAINSLNKASRKSVLACKGLHQSLFFATDNIADKIDYVPVVNINNHTAQTYTNLPVLLEKIICAEANKQPYKTILLNGMTYEGIVQDLDYTLDEIAKAGPSINTIIVDEAWGAISNFDEKRQNSCALKIAKKIYNKYGVTLIVIHSAHKSMFALRQGSFVHCVGSKDAIKRLEQSKYKLHTTSPSYPILASLDLARAQAFDEGHLYTTRAHKLALQLKTDIAHSKLSEHFSVLMQGKNLNNVPDYVFFDDTKIWIGSKNKNITGKILREILFYQYGIYISRYTENAIMINIHIGITVSDIDYLLYAIENITKKLLSKQRNLTGFTVPQSSNQYIIPYPPGVPLVVPGEHVSESAKNKLNMISKAGISLMVIDA